MSADWISCQIERKLLKDHLWKSIFRPVLVLLIIFLTACQSPTSTTTTHPLRTSAETASQTPAPKPKNTAPQATRIPTPTPDPRTINPRNVDRLVQLKILGIGGFKRPPLYSSDGKWLIVDSVTGTVIYDSATYQNIRFLTPASLSFSQIDLSPDGQTLAIGSKRIAVDDGHELPELNIPSSFTRVKEYTQRVRQAKFSPDGKMLALVYSHDKIGIWRLKDDQLQYSLEGEAVEFSSDGRLLVTLPDVSNSNPRIHLYDAQTGSHLQDWPGERAAFLPDDQLAVEDSGVIRVFDLATGKVPAAFNGSNAAFSTDGELVAFLLYDRIWIYHVSDGELVSNPEGDFEGVDNLVLRFSPDGQTLAGDGVWIYCCGGSDVRLSLWQASDGALIRSSKSTGFAFAPDGRSFYAGSQIWNTSDGSTQATLEGIHTNPISALSLNLDGDHLIALSGNLLLFYRVNRDQLDRLQPTQPELPADGMIGIPEKEIDWPSQKVWSFQEANPLDSLTLKLVRNFPFSGVGTAFSPDGQWMATNDGNMLQLWNYRDQNLVLEQKVCSETRISSITFLPDSQRLALTCSAEWNVYYGDQIVQIWQITPDNKLLTEYKAEYPGRGYHLITPSPDGRWLAAANYQVDLWDLADGKRIFTLYLGESSQLTSDIEVVSMVFSPDGQLLVVGLKDGSFELWDTSQGEQLLRVPITEYPGVTGLAFSADGKLLATGLGDGSIRLWGVR